MYGTYNLDRELNPVRTPLNQRTSPTFQQSVSQMMSMGLSAKLTASENLVNKSPGDKKILKKQVDQQKLIIENRIKRLNQERQKTLKIIEKTISTTYRF